MITSAITKEIQDTLTADSVLNDLMEGNKRFTSKTMLDRDFSAQINDTTGGQWPKAVVLGCIDSRVPVELVLIKVLEIFLFLVSQVILKMQIFWEAWNTRAKWQEASW